MKTNSPLITATHLCEMLSKTKTLDGYFYIGYYNDSGIMIHGVHFPSGLCVCSKLNSTLDEYEYLDYEWDDFSEYTKTMILLEVAERHGKQNEND